MTKKKIKSDCIFYDKGVCLNYIGELECEDCDDYAKL